MSVPLSIPFTPYAAYLDDENTLLLKHPCTESLGEVGVQRGSVWTLVWRGWDRLHLNLSHAASTSTSLRPGSGQDCEL